MAREDLMPVTYEKTGYRWEPPDEDFVVEIQPIIAQSVNLCGYELEFNKLKDPQSGQLVYPLYTLDSRKFPPLEKGVPIKSKELKSVLPEILIKLTNPLSPVVRITNTRTIKPEPITNPKNRPKPRPKGK